ncbi:MAG: 50S ribosomal protein L19e [archaeon]
MIHKKKLAARILKTSPKKVRFAADALEDIKKAITRSDLRGLIAIKKIIKIMPNEQSKVRARKIKVQKSKGRRKSRGSKKGSKTSMLSKKAAWMLKVRAQRKFLKELKGKELINSANYKLLYNKSKGGYFRNIRHIKLYLDEQNIIIKKEK